MQEKAYADAGYAVAGIGAVDASITPEQARTAVDCCRLSCRLRTCIRRSTLQALAKTITNGNTHDLLICGIVMQVMMKCRRHLIKLYADEAPDTVGNFVKLVEMGHYNGLHIESDSTYDSRRLPTFKTQCLAEQELAGQAGKFLVASALALKHHRPGILSMANAEETPVVYFFLTTVATPWLNGNHAAFGEVEEEWTLLSLKSRKFNHQQTTTNNQLPLYRDTCNLSHPYKCWR